MNRTLSTCTALLALFGFTITWQPASGAPAQSVDVPPTVDDYIEQVRADWSVPGVAVSIVRDGEIIFEKGYGVLELDRPERVDENTLFGLGSISKTFTTAVVARLVDQGRLNWDDRVIDYLPSFRLADPWVTEHLTVRDILTHRSGLDQLSNDLAWSLHDISRKEYVARLRYVPFSGRFRDSYTYSNGLMDTLGEVIGVVTGVSWEEAVVQEVFEPLKMTRSVSGRDKLVAAGSLARVWAGRAPEGAVNGKGGLLPGVTNVAAPHGPNREGSTRVYPWHHEQANAPGGGVTASARDMGHFMLAHLSAEGYLQPETIQEMFSLQTMHRNAGFRGEAGTAHHLGLGWHISDHRGYSVVGHGGGQIGYHTRTVLVPAENIGITVLTNLYFLDEFPSPASPPALGIIVSRLLDEVLGLPFVDRNTPALDEAAKNRQSLKKRIEDHQSSIADHRIAPTLPLKYYTGDYAHPAFGAIKVESEGESLRFQFDSSVTGTIAHETGDTFRLHFDSDYYPWTFAITFSPGLKRQPVAALTLRYIENLTDEYYPIDWVFQRMDENE